MIEFTNKSNLTFRLTYDGMNYIVEQLKLNVDEKSKNFNKMTSTGKSYFSSADKLARKIADDELGNAIDKGVTELAEYLLSVVDEIKQR